MILTFLYMIPGLISIAWAMALVMKKGKVHKAQKYMAASLTMVGIAVLLFAQYYNPNLRMSYILDFTYGNIAVLCPPIYYITIVMMTELDGFKPKYLWAFVPALFAIGAFSVTSMYSSPKEQMEYMERIHSYTVAIPEETGIMGFFNTAFYIIFIMAETIFCVVATIVKYKKCDTVLKEYYTSSEQANVLQIKGIGIAMTFLAALAIVVGLTPIDGRPLWLSIATITVATITQMILGYMAYSMKETAAELKERLEKEKYEPEKEEKMSKDIYMVISDKLKKAMEEDKMFLNPNLTLMELAEAMNTNRTYVSRVIHFDNDCNFSEYVNNYRVEYAKSLISKDGSRNLTEIAEESGFNNHASFIRQFSRVCGCNPSEWKRQDR